MKTIALGNRWNCVGEPKNQIEKKIKKNVRTLTRQHFLKAAKGLLELRLISESDYAEIKRRTFKKAEE